MKLAKYLVNFFHCPTGMSEVKFAAGQFYQLDEETELHVLQGFAEIVDAPADIDAAAETADKATAAAEKAVSKAVAANIAADAAEAAQGIAAVEAAQANEAAVELAQPKAN